MRQFNIRKGLVGFTALENYMMRILQFVLGLFVILILFQVNNLSICAKEVETRDGDKIAWETAKDFYEITIELMERSATLYNDYGIGGKCFITHPNGSVKLFMFPGDKIFNDSNQPENEYEKDLFDELLSHNGEIAEVHSKKGNTYYYLSLARALNQQHCYGCHGESKNFKKFGSVGAILIEFTDE